MVVKNELNVQIINIPCPDYVRDGTIPCFLNQFIALKVQLCSKEATLVWLTIGNGNVSFLCLAVTLRFFRTCGAAALLM